MRPVQHFISWLVLHWEPESPESPPSQLSQGAAVTAVATARRAITERNCILVDENFDMEEDERCRGLFFFFSRKKTEADKGPVCLIKKRTDSMGLQAVFIADLGSVRCLWYRIYILPDLMHLACLNQHIPIPSTDPSPLGTKVR